MNDNENESRNRDRVQNQRKPRWGPERWVDCCQGTGDADSGRWGDTEMRKTGAGCFSCCRYFLLFLVIVGIIFLLLGYCLNPEITRALWMIGAAVVAGMALFGVLVMRRFAAGSGFPGCCGAWSGRKT